MAISDTFLQDLKFRCDIESVVSRYVNLKKSGRGLVGLCPFHSEKTPSFHVSAEGQFFHCFGCGAGGDVITFLEKIENLDYLDAVRMLCGIAGVPFPEAEQYDGAAALRRKIFEINREAARFFHGTLFSPAGVPGLQYLQKRRLSRATITGFGLGYAPDGWDALLTHLKKKGYAEEEIAASALAAQSRKRPGHYYDEFRGRVIFPIIDIQGNVVAFGGRVLDDSQPKYLNSPDTPVFKKSRCLYALNFAKNANHDTLLLCEGYMDVIAMHQGGFKNAVATLGTSLTPEQARLMARYAKEVIISYDSDAPGQAAAQRAIRLLGEVGLGVRVLKIEGGKDPDEYIRTHGAQRFRLMLEKSANHIDYRLGQARAKYDLALPGQKVAFLKEAVEILATVDNPIEREVYLSRIAQELEISKEPILAELESLRKKSRYSGEKKQLRAAISLGQGVGDRLNPDRSQHLLAANAEEDLLALFYRNPDFFKKSEGLFSGEDFVTGFNRRVFESLQRQAADGGGVDLSRFAAEFNPDEMGRITRILFTRRVSNTWDEARGCIASIRREAELRKLSAPDISPEEGLEIIKKRKLEAQGTERGSL